MPDGTGSRSSASRRKDTRMSEIARIVEQLRQAHDGEAWHGPSVGEALEGVSAAGAALRPIASAHCIWEIVHHVRLTDELVRRRVTGEPATDEADWPPAPALASRHGVPRSTS